MKKRTPWGWIPTLYIAEGLPYFAVNTLTVLMYVNMGISKEEMAFFTGWLYLPWVIKPFWSPFVDLIRSKRWWTITMEALLAITMAGVAFLLPFSGFFATTLAVFWIMAFCSATHDISADGYYMLELNEKEQAAFVGVRSTFYRLSSILGQGGLVIMAGYLEQEWEDIPAAWSATFYVLSAFFLLITLYHLFHLPRAEADSPRTDVTPRSIIKGFGNAFVSFFAKPGIWWAITFMLLYRLPEALCIKLIQPFLVDPRPLGGLALSTTQVGLVNGTIGVIALLAGGIVGGVAIARGGLKKWLWPMAGSLTLPCVLYCILAMTQPQEFGWIITAVAVEQFGYGFGFTAFMMYLIYFSRGPLQTTHYSFCTAFMALGMMLPGMAAGWIHRVFDESWISTTGLTATGHGGYIAFFWLVVACSLFTAIGCVGAEKTLKNDIEPD